MALIYCASSTPLILIDEGIVKLAKNMSWHSSTFKEWNMRGMCHLLIYLFIWMLRFHSLCVGLIRSIFHHLQQALIKTLKQKSGAKCSFFLCQTIPPTPPYKAPPYVTSGSLTNLSNVTNQFLCAN